MSHDRVAIESILLRLKKLEEAVFSRSGELSKRKPSSTEEYKGPKGGLHLLAANGYFDEERQLNQIRTELVKNGYRYSRQAVHMALSGLAKPRGPLVKLSKNAKHAYAKRK